jgi:hypothetical protein
MFAKTFKVFFIDRCPLQNEFSKNVIPGSLVSVGLKKLRVEAIILVGEMNKTFIRKSQPIKNRESVFKLVHEKKKKIGWIGSWVVVRRVFHFPPHNGARIWPWARESPSVDQHRIA